VSNSKNKISKLFSLSINEYRILLKSWLLYAKWDWRVSKQDYKKWQKHIISQPLSPLNETHQSANISNVSNTSDTASMNKILILIQLNEMAGRNHYKHMNCLRRCLSQKELLNSFNIETKLHLGVKFVEGKLAAHSWLSSNNQIINDSAEVISTYQELKTLNDQSTLALLK
jgi:hypothetical protein